LARVAQHFLAMMPARIGIFQKWMSPTLPFGLINPIDDSQDVFVLRSSDGAESLVRGDRVRRASLRARGLQEVRIGFWG
jgi:cold shock CspA family protein